jgi:ferritin
MVEVVWAPVCAPGWLQDASDEEREHAEKLMKYQNRVGGSGACALSQAATCL